MTQDTPPPPDADWSAVKQLFDQALALPIPEREAYVRAQAVNDAVCREVLSLLAFEQPDDPDGGDSFTAGPKVSAFASPPGGGAHGEVLPAGSRLGAWTVVAPLGVGGMAEVVRARRSDGAWEGEAAIKVLKRGMDSSAVLQRFAQEQRALARLRHPHIAALLDAGRTAAGEPYFVMELVEGQPIDQACAGRDLRQRLDLFLQLADAVSCAHRQLLVHRDLKPSNVLVDRDGQVKLLDFGIAKALDPGEGADPGQTMAGQRPFTPSYASPEQVRGELIGTATDVYSLGVLLYVMLTGLRPYGRQAATPQQAMWAVLEEPPTRPSALSPELVTDPDWWRTRKRLQGDLDNILLKALEKPVEQRYASVDALAADVQAFLDGRPVSAHAPHPAYLLGKWIRRNRLVASLTALLLVTLITGVVVSTWQAAQARHRLAGIKSLTREAIFHFGDAVTYVPGGMAIKADLLERLTTVLDALDKVSGDDVDLRGDAAQAYARLADIELNDTSTALRRTQASAAHAERALALARDVLPAKLDDANFLIWYGRALASQARALRMQNKPQAAVAVLSEVLPLFDDAIPRSQQAGRVDAARALGVERARARHLIAQLMFKPGFAHLDRPQEALTQLALARRELQALEVQQHHIEIRYLLGSVDGMEGLVCEALDRLDCAREAMARAMEHRRATVAEMPQDVEYRDALVTESVNQAKVLLRLRRDQEALAASTLGWQLNKTLEAEQPAGADNAWSQRWPRLAVYHGRALRRAGHADQALPVLALALRAGQELAAQPGRQLDGRWLIASVQAERAQALLATGQPGQAVETARAAYAQALAVDDAELAAAAPLVRRTGLLARAELARALALALQKSNAPQAAVWRERALQAWRDADALRPLVGDQAAWRDELMALSTASPAH